MKSHYFLLFYIYFSLFSNSLQISENENKIIERIPLYQNNSFRVSIESFNGIYHTPISSKVGIKVKIESDNEDLNDYYFKYYYIKEDEDNIYIENNQYYNESQKIMIIPKAQYIIVEMMHKFEKTKLFLKSKIINYENFNYLKNFVENNYNELNLSNQFMFDKYSGLIFVIIFCFASTISVILNFLDLKEDKKIVDIYNLTSKQRANEEYQILKKTNINGNTFLFSCFLMKYIYPIFNIFNIYNFEYPRYIRFFIIIIKMMLNFIISMLCVIYFTKDMNIVLKLLISFLFSSLASMIIYIFTKLITIKILRYDIIRRDIWKPKFECLRKYIFYTVKKDILFNSKWHSIRNRMISYTRICGNLALKQKPLDKYKIYSDNKTKYNKNLSKENISFDENIISKNKEERESEEFFQKYISNTYSFKSKNNSNNLITNNNINRKTFYAKENGKNLNSLLYIEKGVQSFCIYKLGNNTLKLKTVQKIEDIKNRYIVNINDMKFDETLEVNSFVKTYDNLEIESLDNYTYISTDSMNNQLRKTNSDSKKIYIKIISTFILLMILVLVDYGFTLICKLIIEKNDEEGNYINYCIIIVIVNIIVINFFLNYLFSLAISYYFIHFYGYEKKNSFYKKIFKLLIEKYIKYIYRIRLLINKYNKELEFIGK